MVSKSDNLSAFAPAGALLTVPKVRKSLVEKRHSVRLSVTISAQKGSREPDECSQCSQSCAWARESWRGRSRQAECTSATARPCRGRWQVNSYMYPTIGETYLLTQLVDLRLQRRELGAELFEVARRVGFRGRLGAGHGRDERAAGLLQHLHVALGEVGEHRAAQGVAHRLLVL